jgi:hypothetical protein
MRRAARRTRGHAEQHMGHDTCGTLCASPPRLYLTLLRETATRMAISTTSRSGTYPHHPHWCRALTTNMRRVTAPAVAERRIPVRRRPRTVRPLPGRDMRCGRPASAGRMSKATCRYDRAVAEQKGACTVRRRCQRSADHINSVQASRQLIQPPDGGGGVREAAGRAGPDGPRGPGWVRPQFIARRRLWYSLRSIQVGTTS